MNDKNLIENSIVICPKAKSKRLIAHKSKNAPGLNVKFFTKEEIFEGVYFKYGLEAIDYISREYNYSLENSEEIIANSYSVSSFDDNTQTVMKIKDDLLNKGLLKINERFKSLFKNRIVIVSGYSKLDKELNHALSLLSENIQYVSEENESIQREIFNFPSADEEVNWVFEKISELSQKQSLNDVFILKPGPEYDLLLKKYSHYYHIPIQLDEKQKLVDSPIFHDFLNLLSSYDVHAAYDILKKKDPDDKYDALGKLADSINACAFALPDIDHFKTLLTFVAGKTDLRPLLIDPSIKIVDESIRIDENQHIFVLGFSLGAFPRVSLDNDFYSDIEKESLFMNDSKTKSEIASLNLVSFLNANKNIVITRKKMLDNQKFFDSPIGKRLGYINKDGHFGNHFHSSAIAHYRVGIAKDHLRLYNVDSQFVDSYSDSELKYNSFDRTFKGLKNFSLPTNFHLSYTALNEFNECPFEFYLKRILGLNTFESNFFSNIGVLFHQILQDSVHKQINFDDYKKFINDSFLTEEEKFFVENLLPKVLDVINTNESFKKQTKFNRISPEEKITIDFEPRVKFTGTLDKILFDEECKNIAVVDYKTSDFSYVDADASHGIDMQLPIYAYLLSERYPDYQISGLYIQNVLFDPLKKEENERDYIPYILKGLTLLDTATAKRLDTTIGTTTNEKGDVVLDSCFIRNISLSKGGEIKKGNIKTLLDKCSFDEKIELTKRLISLALQDIKHAEFAIRPFYDKQSSPCTFCGCKDICFAKKSDSIPMDKYYDLVDRKLAEMTKEVESDEI